MVSEVNLKSQRPRGPNPETYYNKNKSKSMIDGTCSMYGLDVNCLQSFSVGIIREETTCET
jgi:hypothetical protein